MLTLTCASHQTHLPRSHTLAAIITVEHGGTSAPYPWRHTLDFKTLGRTHWASDLHIAPLAISLAERIKAPCIIAHFSRLLIDPNREPSSATLIPDHVVDDGLHLSMPALKQGERRERIRRLYAPYHKAVDCLALHYHTSVLLSLHSFTPLYRGIPRAHEAGVLFNEDTSGAAVFLDSLRHQGIDAQPNWPYSGRDGFIFSAETHARRHTMRHAIEIELRQDRLEDSDFVSRSLSALTTAILSLT